MADESVPMPLSTATRRCSELLRRIMVSESILGSALEIPKMSTIFQAMVFRDHETGKSGLREVLGQFTSPADLEENFSRIAEALAKQAAVNGEMVISGAVVVLAHSIADEAFTSACDMAAALNPAEWIPELNMERTIKLRALREEGPDRIFQRELESFRKTLSDKSLPNRAELLFRHVKIVHNSRFAPTDPEYFTCQRLRDADDLRHKIVHENALPQTNLKQSTEMKLFFHEAGSTALRSLCSACRIPLDPKILFPGITTIATNSAFYGE